MQNIFFCAQMETHFCQPGITLFLKGSSLLSQLTLQQQTQQLSISQEFLKNLHN